MSLKIIQKFIFSFIVFTSILFFTFENLNEQFPEHVLKLFNVIDVLSIDPGTLNTFKIDFFLKATGSFLPIIAITVYEFFIYRQDLDKISLLRIKKSKGYFFADFWYYIFQYVGKFPLIITLLTLGFSNINNDVSNWFSSLYKLCVPYPNSELFATFIFIIALLIANLIGYLRHRMEHKIPFIWDLHEFHHSATEMTIFSNFRVLPITDIVTAPFTLPVLAFTGLLMNEYIIRGYKLPLYIFVLDSFILFIFIYFGHSSTKLIYPKPLSFLLMSPSLHWIHHSNNPKHFDKNFGAKYVIWDKVFGTYLDESHLKDIKSFGIKYSQYNKYNPLYSYAILPFQKIFRRIKQKKMLSSRF